MGCIILKPSHNRIVKKGPTLRSEKNYTSALRSNVYVEPADVNHASAILMRTVTVRIDPKIAALAYRSSAYIKIYLSIRAV